MHLNQPVLKFNPSEAKPFLMI